jgi:translation elongation factor EF-Ts
VDTMKQVREVRSQSGASLSVCKRVLVQVDGDVARAIEVLRKQGLGGVEGALAETRTEDEKGER